MNKLDLSSVTLAGVVYNDNPELLERTCRVLRYCEKLADIYDIHLFTATPPPSWFVGRVTQIPLLDRSAFQTWTVKSAVLYLQSEYLAWINEDGFPLRPERWSPDFLKYDFVGAAWYDRTIGNNGFSIQSHRFMRAVAYEMPWHQRCVASDWWALHDNDPAKYGLSVAPFEVANRFSLEYPPFRDPEHPALGFHGRTLNPEDYKLGWGLIEQSEK